MGSASERDNRIEALNGLLERLCSPDLTLAEAKDLRGRLAGLVDRRDGTPVDGKSA
ncbi:hypothetical protein [Tautonia plasticadhaerens]|uniref:Uncharacterized protein n=1 Tax=Tautonia plasticadhaerens TaxID=2527974 RepID=A0A518HA26_9BACT|nr:hypothetical protein [Tautonia plasticadhaerens]QDV37596.1 hypothetical protein ElP_55360 [Tautonia plasticadhaerens]